MGADSKIEWTDATWNPLRGCEAVSPGCANCYAAGVAARFGGPGLPYDGLAKRVGKAAKWTGALKLLDDPDHLLLPHRWQKPRRVFVNSMSDLFHKDAPDGFIDKVFAVMAFARHHSFQVLTKRADRMAEYVTRLGRSIAPVQAAARELGFTFQVPDPTTGRVLSTLPWPIPNVWLGVSVEDQQRADERVPHLLKTPAVVRFLSCEPLLSAVDLSPGWGTRIDWVIAGGESGPNARPMHPAWPRSLRDQCQAAGVPFFFKQWGEWGPIPATFDYRPAFGSGNPEYARALHLFARKHGANRLLDDRPEGWDATMVREGTCVLDGQTPTLGRVGKKAAGRLLDGRTWDEYPTPVEARNG